MLGDNLAKLRKKQGLSQQQVADLLGVSRQTISNWELDQGAPTLEHAARLAAAYEVSIDDLASANVEVATSSREPGTAPDLHVLRWLVGKTVRLESSSIEWVVAAPANQTVHVLDVNPSWMRVSYERTKPSTLLQKETVIQLLDLNDIQAAMVVPTAPDQPKDAPSAQVDTLSTPADPQEATR